MSDETLLTTTREFWNSNPCGSPSEYVERRKQRYAMEPWLPGVLERIASRHRNILEIGCGQGVDTMQLCTLLPERARYTGIDYSTVSVETAQATVKALAGGLALYRGTKGTNSKLCLRIMGPFA